MADFRLAQNRNSHVWLIMGGFAVLAALLWASAFFFGDATAPTQQPRVGAAADFGAARAPVLPIEAVPFASVIPLQTRDLGRLVRLSGTVESRVAQNSVWVRTSDGHRILARFEPAPSDDLLAGIGPGSTVGFEGYLQTIALAEFRQIVDSLHVQIPRPPPGRKFGDLPDPAFAHVDSLFIKNFYVSVRPRGIHPEAPTETAT